MGVIKFRTTAEPVWISAADEAFDKTEIGHYPKEEREKIEFLINPLTSSLIEKVQGRNTKVKNEIEFIDGKRHIRRVPTTTDEYSQDLMSSILADWKGVVGEDEKEMECNKENIMAILEGYPSLGEVWIDLARWAISRYDEMTKSDRSKSLKNSKSSQGGRKDVEKK